MTWAWVPNGANGVLQPIDLVYGRVGAISSGGTAPVLSAGSVGKGYELTSSNGNYASTNISDLTTLIGTAEAACLFVTQKLDSTNRNSCAFAPTSAGTTARFASHAPYSDGTTYFDFGGSSGSNRISVAGLDYSKPTAFLMSGALNGLRIVQDGVLRASSSTTVTRTADTNNILQLMDNGNNTDLQRFYAIFFWARDIQLQEAQSLSANPWQLLNPIQQKWFFSPPAGISDTLMAQACL